MCRRRPLHRPSLPTCHGFRIERLIGCGVIQVGAVVNPQALGLDVIADVFLEVALGRVREVAERFAALKR